MIALQRGEHRGDGVGARAGSVELDHAFGPLTELMALLPHRELQQRLHQHRRLGRVADGHRPVQRRPQVVPFPPKTILPLV